MKLKSLGLTNFRGFDRLDIEFDERMTVIAGVNGVGKSTILQAIAIAYSHVLPEFTVSREKRIPILNSDIQQGKSSCIIEIWSDGLEAASLSVFLSKEDLGRNEKLSLEHKQSLMRQNISKLEKGTPDYKNLKNDISWVDKRLEGDVDRRLNWMFIDTYETEGRLKRYLKSSPTQALVVYYSTHRLLSRLPPKIKGELPLKQSAAFSKSLTQLEVSLNEFAKWHRAINSFRVVRKDGKYALRVLDLLQEAIAGLMPQIKAFWFHENNPPRYSVVKDVFFDEQANNKESGKEFFLEQLSDGERGLIALVFDLTRRLAIANPDIENPIAEGKALVLIDEIELHLHPKWQREILPRLRNTFKSCQFVVTTHSPQVIGEVEAKCVRLLTLKEGKVISETPSMAYGTDSNWILSVLMGADEMNEDVERSIEEIAKLTAERNLESAKERLSALRQRVGNSAAVQKISSTIERMERLGR
ncbi:AAA family ATPase [Pseudomonas mosselii]|uniref:AAA family ATPase n=1 Tax=Pseudomonas mosselii TaxID=78327 RepID=UPI002448A7EA|nr:AAA family ATPase [Pseudomonas mosselii]MDH0629547.1 AAA family ATPase [Pseudomonas mosselii]MDH0680473.1 AAA family ATPase [Pseudomonas mosselii]MDH0927059.1 AAA family ATPase [Pseudomonas mosselii]MDH1136312.1 AAA family ATPase [Pseudomonas mosselii]MDH1141155.1 AAA family ATPase [Pseudomonas mosselii]